MNPFRRPSAGQRTPILALQPEPKEGEGGVVSLRLYDPIDSWGDIWGISSKEFAATLDALPDDTKEIRLLINSPGGEVWEGLAILNALRSHPAKVVAVVEGIAASSASFIAAGVDELHIMKNAELFVHKAWGLALGNSEDMAKMAADLDHEDRNIASIYADKAGGTVEEWLAVMAAETFYSADEAVEAKLADKVIDPKSDNGGAAEAKARFDLSVFAHAGRQGLTPQATGRAGENTHYKEGADMTSDAFILGLRERLGIKAEAELDEAGLLAAVDEALAESEEPTPEPTIPAGTVLVDKATLDDLRAKAQQGAEARTQQLEDRRMALVEGAIADGRVAPARRQAWLDKLAADPGEEQTLASLEPGLVPVAPIGHAGGVLESNDDDRIFALAWGSDTPKGA